MFNKSFVSVRSYTQPCTEYTGPESYMSLMVGTRSQDRLLCLQAGRENFLSQDRLLCLQAGRENFLDIDSPFSRPFLRHPSFPITAIEILIIIPLLSNHGFRKTHNVQ